MAQIEYAWKDIEIALLGRVLVRVLDIKYKPSVEQKEIYGRGKKVLGIQTGNEKNSGSITIGQSEFEALNQKVKELKPGSKIIDYSFDIDVAYVADGVMIRDRIVGAKINEYEKGMKQGDVEMLITMPFLCVEIQEQI